MNHRHAERRALVAEACGALAPYVASEMRPSLILSILQQMSTDADAIVRRAVVHSLTHLLPLLPDLEKLQAVSFCCLDKVDARSRLAVSLHTCLELINLHLSATAFHQTLHVCTLHASAKVQYMQRMSFLVHIRECQESERCRHGCNNSPATVQRCPLILCVFVQVQNLLLQLAKDPSQDVVDASFEHLLPGVLKWMADIRLLHTSLLPAVLSEIRALIER